MLAELTGLSVRWNHPLEDIMGLVVVAAVAGVYSLVFAFTRRPRRGWAITALVSFAAMAALIWASPSTRRTVDASGSVACDPPVGDRRAVDRAAPTIGAAPRDACRGAGKVSR